VLKYQYLIQKPEEAVYDVEYGPDNKNFFVFVSTLAGTSTAGTSVSRANGSVHPGRTPKHTRSR
jgi:hypothetical protein